MPANPFEITKAVDFTDEQIAENWVDLPGGGFASLADPRSPMPKFLVGGKGGGRTHLLRYYSFALQRIRHKDDVAKGLREEGYVGIYSLCSGLNASRFQGKRQSADTWSAVFAFYMEVWLGRLTIDTIISLHSSTGTAPNRQEQTLFAEAVCALFDSGMELSTTDADTDILIQLAHALQRMQRQLDVAINNSALTHRLDIQISTSPGSLVFGIPKAARQFLPSLSELTFAFLLDEFENLSEDQQKYVNTLVREKSPPTTFIIGSRRFGLRTFTTLSAGEENRQGSEFDMTVLEDAYRAKEAQYRRFCESIVRKRLVSFGVDFAGIKHIQDYFNTPALDGSTIEDRARLYVDRPGNDCSLRPWLVKLQAQLVAHGYSATSDRIVELLSIPASPLHEKFAVFLLYRDWANHQNLLESATNLSGEVSRIRGGSGLSKKLGTTYKHYRMDLYAQLLSDLEMPLEYFGLENLIRMSGFLPRNLLVVLKQVTRWSLFLGESPFRGEKVSLRAQNEGIREASGWFLADNKGLGDQGEETGIAIRRLGSAFYDLRFCDKPVEVSCSAFETDRQGLSASALRTLDSAVAHSLILEIPIGRRDRNTRVLHHKYQLNPMLAPLFGLSLARRGTVEFTAQELTSIFDASISDQEFSRALRRRLNRMTVPFSGEATTTPSLF